VSIIAVLFLIINLIFAPHNPYQEKYSIFECGFHSFLGQNRTQFGIKFFIYALIYLLLDLEILLIFPFALSTYINGIYGIVIALIFITIVTIGFIFELGKGALKIDSRQNINNIEKINTLNISYIGNVLGKPKRNINHTPIHPSSSKIPKTTLESSFNPFKSITLKGLCKVIIISIILYFVKSHLYTISQHLENNMLSMQVFFSALAFLIGCTLNETFDYLIKDLNINLFDKKLVDITKDLTHSMKSGESSKTGGESSKTGGESSKSGRVIT